MNRAPWLDCMMKFLNRRVLLMQSETKININSAYMQNIYAPLESLSMRERGRNTQRDKDIVLRAGFMKLVPPLKDMYYDKNSQDLFTKLCKLWSPSLGS